MKKFDGSLSLLAWAYNEEILIGSFLDRAIALMEGVVDEFEIVLIDDCSNDSTNDIASDYAKRDPRIRLLRNERNLNVGLSCRRAVEAATKDFLFWQTVDWSYDLTNLAIHLQLLKYYDVVQGVRPTPVRLLSYIPVIRSLYRIQSRSDNFSKAIVSLGNYYVLRLLFGVSFHDFQNVTIYPRALVQAFDMRARSSFVNPEFLIRAHIGGAHFIEVPIPFIPRQEGEASGTRPSAIMRSVLDIFQNWIEWGWRLRLSDSRPSGHIDRVSEPLRLNETVARLVVPLFKYFH